MNFLKKALISIFFLIMLIGLNNSIFASEKIEQDPIIREMQENKYSKEYELYMELPEEERKNIGVIPNKYEIPFEKIYDIVKKQRRNSNLETVAGQDVYPVKYDLRDKIDIKIENQYNTSLCWAFATSNSLETYLALNYDISKDFSEYHVDYIMSTEFDYNDILERELHSAGNIYMYLNYLIVGKGPVSETEVPFGIEYTIDDYDKLNGYNSEVFANSFVVFPRLLSNATEEEKTIYRNAIKEHIMKNGSLYAQINMDIGYNKNTFALNNQYSTIPNHAVSIIGWDDSYSRTNFSKMPQNDGAYIVLNSWGETFGENGIFYISYEDLLVNTGLAGVDNARLDDTEFINIEFKDVNLYNAINDEFDKYILEKSDELLTIKINPMRLRLEYNKTLDLSGYGIKDISGLEYFGFVRDLDLSDNQITDVQPISYFKNLTTLDLSGNPLNCDLEKIPDAYNIYLSNCGLDDMSGFITSNRPRTTLTELFLKDNDIKDVSKLKIRNNNNVYVYRILDLSGNMHIDYSTFDVPAITFYLQNTGLTDESLKLVNFYNLETNILDISKNDISELNQINLSKLNVLNISYTNIDTVPVLPNLYSLYADGTKNISGIEELENLLILSLSNCNLSNLSTIENYNIERLILANNNLTEIGDALNFPNLKALILDGNPLNFEIFPTISTLNELSLANTSSDSVKAIEKNTQLNKVYLNNNNLENASVVAYINKPNNFIDLSNNKITTMYSVINDNVNINYDNNNINKRFNSVKLKSAYTSCKNQKINLTYGELNLGEEYKFDIPEIIKDLYSNRHKTNLKIITEGCEIDYLEEKITINSNNVGENIATITVKNGGIFEKSTVNLSYTIIDPEAGIEEEPLNFNEYKFGYEVKNNYILDIKPKTDIASFKNNLLNQNGYSIIVKENKDTEELVEEGKIKTGMYVAVLNENSDIITEFYTVVKGDINCDGIADGKDTIFIKALRAETIRLAEAQVLAADIDNNGIVNFNDSKLLLLHRAEVDGYNLNY